MSDTLSIPHPHSGVAPLRVNALIGLFDLTNGELFVGDLAARENDFRDYRKSMVEGGIDKGERLEPAMRRELREEVGVHDAVFLGAARTPVAYYFNDWATAKKYSGKLYVVSAFAIENRAAINLSSGDDTEGATFRSHVWRPLSEVTAELISSSRSPTHHRFIEEAGATLRPIAQALATLRHMGAARIDAASIRKAMSAQDAERYSTTLAAGVPILKTNDPLFITPSAPRPPSYVPGATASPSLTTSS